MIVFLFLLLITLLGLTIVFELIVYNEGNL